jgi:hypothetical protein
MSLIQTIESDLAAAGKWVETEAETVASEAWSVIKSVFQSGEPTIVNGVVAALKEFLPTVGAQVAAGTPLQDLEQNFIMWALREGKIVLASVEHLGSTMVQSLIGLTIKSLPTPPTGA